MNISAAKTYIELLGLSRSMANGKKMYEFQKRCLDGIYICLRGDYIQDPETGKMMGSRPSEKVDKSGDSGIIKLSEKFEIPQDKIKKFLLSPGAKHADEFFDVGYKESDYEKLFDDIESNFDISKITDVKKSSDGTEDYSVFMNLGITSKKRFRTVWRKDTPNSKPRLITAHRED